jgi:hypothetical protein
LIAKALIIYADKDCERSIEATATKKQRFGRKIEPECQRSSK